MKTMVRTEMAVESKEAMLRLRVEKPPVEQTVKAWQMASNQFMPASR